MKIIINVIAYIIIHNLSIVLTQDYLVNSSDDFYSYKRRYKAAVKPSGENVTLPKSFPKSKNSFKNIIPRTHKRGKIVECRGMTKKLHKMGKEVICKPRKTLVKLNPDPGYIYIPDVILIDRCDGRCGHDSQSCMPIESTSSKVLVQRMQIGSFDSPCYELDVEKHTRCKCGCDLTPDDCNSRQRFNDDECVCECNNLYEQLDCTSKDGMYWNRETCRCSCSIEEETCSDGLMWIPSLCRCAQVMVDG
ncbi:vascular endothelial growth factor A-A-like isoform X2 [Chelonus insularis]|uniref:vascular endothelial growth factor A-A-like isoform X2 n=1 Tax=Chelonus insularis TaxID=460826 RepID=UPI00158AE182|nr:vascular endothelial growth factor A-A-like isoform X2 [Chelonus insularis]